ncbi:MULTISPECIES: DUF881 domain-containing protein [Rhodococcus]|jgi:uncharacterized protein YlxW (UPF0749 family)|uniref:DUF881 domain-containing protein n=1 Tax=Rhodococcus aetherivorans TaxID=191292 RepID=A0A059MQB1_9NOCA|nr:MULTISPECIES: DUF881 domain-containing protein [Rhodococcus]ETT24417.1 protein of unknown function DUF881 [Rhodococcus rhodochrous ATCC 21198]AKE90200.1 membrane protein [Rhodococcus aetherivorans]KDE13345.1 membrane protein [Rhodococcus aetherivorans]MDV6292186.1 DUF881 domain-containing protein [Rhodococcus aetherivorans]NGP29343.1 DUF881 domain-containing protein [Rhodococcus aetherivorans]
MSRNWEQIRRNPVPSLLKALLEDHLDPGYAAAAHDRAAGHARPSRVGIGLWLVLGGLLAGLVLGVAYAQNIERESGTDQARNEILATVRTAEDRNDVLAATRDDVATQVEQRRIEVLADDEQGAAVLDRLARAEEAAAAAPVRGPGITVTLADPTSRPDLTDSAEKDRARSTSVILDRDLQSVVNALWAGGAEAVAINGVRVGPGVTVRQAGGAMLVDNQPVFSPYTVAAVGSPAELQTGFVVSDAYLRMSGVQQLYGVGFTITEATDLALPGASVRDVASARETGER